jgi:uncharacterized protein YjlB
MIDMELRTSDYTCEKFFVRDNGIFPNSMLPVIHYVGVFEVPALFPGISVRAMFKEHGWSNSWRSGIFEYHHYHSNTFEVMGVINGSTSIMIGGDSGKVIVIHKGDVLIIPPGVAHRNLGEEHQITCIGAYPRGIRYNIRSGKVGERPRADHQIQRVAWPEKNPVFGTPYLQSVRTAEADFIRR